MSEHSNVEISSFGNWEPVLCGSILASCRPTAIRDHSTLFCDSWLDQKEIVISQRLFVTWSIHAFYMTAAVFFSERVINVWNQLHESTDFSSLSSFMRNVYCIDVSSNRPIAWCWPKAMVLCGWEGDCGPDTNICSLESGFRLSRLWADCLETVISATPTATQPSRPYGTLLTFIRNAMRIQGSGVSLYAPSRWQKDTIKLLQLIENYTCFRFLKFLFDNYILFLG